VTSIITFYIALPFRLNVPEGTEIQTILMNGREPEEARPVGADPTRHVHVRILQTEVPLPSGVPAAALDAMSRDETGVTSDGHRARFHEVFQEAVESTGTTVVAAATAKELSAHERGSELGMLDLLLERVLDAVNHVIVGYNRRTRSAFAWELTRADLGDAVPFYDSAESVDESSVGLHVWERPHHDPHDPSLSEVELYEELADMDLDRGFPTDRYMRVRLRAQNWFERHAYDEAIRAWQTAAELLLRTVYRLLLVDHGNTDREIRQAQEETTFAALPSRLQHRLGGSASEWQTEGSGTFARYWNDMYETRNKIMHAGHVVQREQARKAGAAFDGLLQFLGHRLSEMRNLQRYPRTALKILGRGPFEDEDGHVKESLRAQIYDINGGRSPYWEPAELRTDEMPDYVTNDRGRVYRVPHA
jgi:hypothetical protein